jgi:hypothetical protein
MMTSSTGFVSQMVSVTHLLSQPHVRRQAAVLTQVSTALNPYLPERKKKNTEPFFGPDHLRYSQLTDLPNRYVAEEELR